MTSLHEYNKDEQSGAGNCNCGAPERHQRHPHIYTSSIAGDGKCVCGLVPESYQHMVSLLKGLE